MSQTMKEFSTLRSSAVLRVNEGDYTTPPESSDFTLVYISPTAHAEAEEVALFVGGLRDLLAKFDEWHAATVKAANRKFRFGTLKWRNGDLATIEHISDGTIMAANWPTNYPATNNEDWKRKMVTINATKYPGIEQEVY